MIHGVRLGLDDSGAVVILPPFDVDSRYRAQQIAFKKGGVV
jgi:hypothetical protein